MVADLVDQYVVDEMLERLALRRPFVEDRRGGKRRMRSGSVPDMLDAFLGRSAGRDRGR